MIDSVLPVYKRLNIEIERGEGAYLYDTEGKSYLDFVSGIAVNSLGHCHPALIEALNKQADKLWHVSNLFQIPGLEDFAKQLLEKTFADTVFFCSSGAEAIECAIKMVRKYHDATGNPDKYRIITFTGAFHGRTLAAIWASKRDKMMQDGFGPPVEGFDNVEFNNLDAVRAAITDETAAILVEPIQGDGGIRPCTPEFIQGVRDIADAHGLLLCFDEIQTGVGRSGYLYAHEHFGIYPDIMTTAKGIGGGFPLGGCLATEKAASGMTIGTHGSTYGGNPLAMAVGAVVLQEISKTGFLEHIRELGGYLTTQLIQLAQTYPNIIKEVRGIGFIQGLQLHSDSKAFCGQSVDYGLLLAPAADNVVRLLPPLIIERLHIDEAITALDKLCRNLTQNDTLCQE